MCQKHGPNHMEKKVELVSPNCISIFSWWIWPLFSCITADGSRGGFEQLPCARRRLRYFSKYLYCTQLLLVVLFWGFVLRIYRRLRQSFLFGAVGSVRGCSQARWIFTSTFFFILCEGHILSIYYMKGLQILSGKRTCLFGVCFCKGRLMT